MLGPRGMLTPVRARWGVGAFFTLLGIACWVSAWRWLPPVAVVMSEGMYVPNWHAQIDSVALRWGAVAVAVGGLALVTRLWRVGTWLSVGLGAAWLGADAALEATSAPTTAGPLAVAVLVAIAAATVLVAARRAASSVRDAGPARGLLFWSGVLLGTAPDILLYNFAYRDPIGPVALVAAVAGASFALAVTLALAAGPSPVSRARTLAGGVLAGAIAVLTVLAVAHDDGPLSVAIGMARVASPLVAATLVALAGVLPGGGRGVRGFFALLGVGLIIVWPLTLGGLFALSSSVGGRLSGGLGWSPSAVSLVTGVFTGLLLLVGAGLARRWAAATPTPATPTPVTPTSAAATLGASATAQAAAHVTAADPGRAGWGWRPVVGAIITATGVAGWVAMALWVHPVMTRQWLPRGSDGANSFAAIGWDARWAAIVLAAGGLRLLSHDRTGAIAGVVAWVCADLALAYVNSSSGNATPWAVVAVAVLVLVGAAALRVRPGAASSPPVGPSLVYSGISGGVAVLFIGPAEGPASDPRATLERMLPAGAVPVLLALSAALVVAAVVAALAAHPAPGPGRVVAAGVVAVVGAAGVVGQSVWRLTLIDESSLLALPVAALTVAALVLVCAGLAGLFDRVGHVRRVGLIGAVGIAGPFVTVGALVVSSLPGILYWVVWPPLDTPFTVDDASVPFSVVGLLLGVALAGLALLAQAWPVRKATLGRL